MRLRSNDIIDEKIIKAYGMSWDNFVMLPNDCQKLLISKYWKLGLKNSKTRDLKEEYQKLLMVIDDVIKRENEKKEKISTLIKR